MAFVVRRSTKSLIFRSLASVVLLVSKQLESEFGQFFGKLSAGKHPRDWQWRLSKPPACGNRLIRVPTGFGKTLGVFATWAWYRVHLRDDDWPRRLIWCLPMRVLVEQTEREIRLALEQLGALWDGKGAHDGKVGVHFLMGGADAGEWHLHPERDAVLVGTQDMLLSRALNRGYASPRARWPMEFGLLNQDALWVMDEVQLMDVGLATAGQLQGFRSEDRVAGKSLRPCYTWWMSATLQRAWLEKSPDTADLANELSGKTHTLAESDRVGELWEDIAKPLKIWNASNIKALAPVISRHHRDRGCGKNGPTLVVLNTVKRAVDVWKALQRDKALERAATDIRLAHSRFRPAERKDWRAAFLNREACAPGMNRIVVSTQVVEAGVDMSASLLITELAPWPSLVQRFGRCARWGGKGQVIVADFNHNSDKKAAPYSVGELDAAREACDQLADVGPRHLEWLEKEHESLLETLYPYEPTHLLLRHELDDLFDTSPDLSGADIDISRFIRSGTERDVQVFWHVVGDDGPDASVKPTRDELCSVPFLSVREWLFKPKSEGLKPGVRAWVWDWLDRKWRNAAGRDIYPGQTVLVDAGVGGYVPDTGWDPAARVQVDSVQMDDNVEYESRPCWKRNGEGWVPSERRVRKLPPEDNADAAEDDESLSITRNWGTIASHGWHVGVEVERIATEVAPAKAKLLHLAGRWHDLGKAHPAFQVSIQADGRPQRDDIAKAPEIAWPCSPKNMYEIDVEDQRHGFRHELASTLGLFGVLQRHDPEHEALLGPWRGWLEAMSEANAVNGPLGGGDTIEPTTIEQEILDLGSDEFDLLAYLVCAHHGKVRMAWHASPADQKADGGQLRIRGVREGDTLPPVPLAAADGGFHQLPATALNLSPSEVGLSPRTGRSWTERVLNLLERFGPFTLAWMEALLRAADQRASRRSISDTLLHGLEGDDAECTVDESRSTLAQPAAGGAPSPPSGGDSASCSELHGDGGRTGGRGVDSGTTRTPYSATRYVETSVGILSYCELAPLLAERVAETELVIAGREFADMPIRDLLLALHHRICIDLTPDMAGRWRRRDVRVGAHSAPPHWQVQTLMHAYARDLEARLASLGADSDELLIDALTFAEGRLLNIHPFEDFNGRVSRLFLVELLYRLDLPVVDPATSSVEETKRYFAALQAYDRRDPRPLATIWRSRLDWGSPQ